MKINCTLPKLKSTFIKFKNRFLYVNSLTLLLFIGFSQFGFSNSNPEYPIKPVTVNACVVNIGNGLYSATFSYNNPNNRDISVGDYNSFLTFSKDNRRVNVLTEFKKGIEDNSFTVEFTADDTVKWTVITNGQKRKCIASANSNVCSEEDGVIFPVYDQGDGKTDVVLGIELTALANGRAGDEPSELIFQINAEQKVFVEIIPRANQLQAVLNLLTNTYDLQYNVNPLISDFAIDPTQIISEQLASIDVFFPISNLNELNNFSQIINFVRPLYPPSRNAGIVTSQGDGAQMSNIVRESFKLVRDDEIVSVDGTGVKIGVISDSYDTQPFTGKTKATVDVENGDLPGVGNPNGYTTPVDVLKDYPYGVASDEGRAMMQIIHDVAPGADLAFHTGIISPRDFEIAIKELDDAGCTFIVDDITFPLEPFFGDGRIAQAIKEFTNSPGKSYVTSAGNFADNGYQNGFTSSSSAPSTNFIPSDSPTRAHVFGENTDGTEDIFQKISVVPGIYMIVLQWDENQASQENSQGAAVDLDIYLVDDQGRLIVGNNRMNEAGDPTEIIVFQSTGIGEANILITSANGAPPAGLPFRYIAFQSNGLEITEYAGAPTVSGHAMTSEAVTVAAIDYRVALNPTSQKFSSYGGTLPNTTSLEIDFSAPDGVNTNVGSIGQDIDDDDDDFPNFFGTSASAPHAVAAMALLESAALSWYPGGLPIDGLQLFKQTAIPFGTVDRAGAGLINATEAFKQIAAQTPKITQLFIEDGKTPSSEPFEVTILGEFLPENPTVIFDGQELEIISVNEFQIVALVNAFTGNPPLVVNATPITPSGTDGGDSNPLFFFDDGKFAINIIADDISVEFGQEVTFSFTVEGLADGVTFESLDVPVLKFTTPAVFPYPDVNNYAITASFETPLTDVQKASYQVNFVNAILAVTKKDLLISPVDEVITYGDVVDLELMYEYNTNGITDNNTFLQSIQTAHQLDFYSDNSFILINKLRAVVNEQEIIDSLNNGSWMASERVIQNKLRAVVNGTNILDLEVQNLIDFLNSEPDPITNKLRAVVNKLRAVVNGQDLFDNNIDLFIENKLRAVVNETGLGGVNDDNEYSSVFAVIDAEDGSTETEDRSIDKIYSMNMITGLDVTGPNDEDRHYIFPGAFLAPIAANFNNFYDAARIKVLPANLQAAISNLTIDKGEEPDLTTIVSQISGFVLDENIVTVFPDGIPYIFVDASGTEYQVGDIGDFDIKIENPENYNIAYTQSAKLIINEPQEFQYCDDDDDDHYDGDDYGDDDDDDGDDDDDDDEHRKVLICHKGKTKCISINAVQAHLNHGDSLGSCEEDDSDDYGEEENYEEDNAFKLYPNPVHTTLTLKNKKSKKGDLFIYDMYGNLYKHKKLKKKQPEEININMRSFPSGIYVVRIVTKKKVRSYNIVKN
jgi:hypothetical protein